MQTAQSADKATGSGTPLVRGIGLGSATALNMIDMIGVGPFITIPLIGAAMPGSGGSYRYLKEIYGPQKLGRLISFLFIWQLSFSAPLSIASGSVGLSQYAAFFWPGLEHVWATQTWSLHLPLAGVLQVSWVAMPATLVAIGVCLFTAFLLYRRITVIGRLSRVLWVGVMGTIGWIIFVGLTHFNARQAFDFPPGAFTFSRDFFHGLGGAMLVAAYDYWGYYNVCFLGDEIKEPGKNIPRALLLSIVALVVIRIRLQFRVQSIGVIVLRIRRPDMARPFRMWLYPVPALVAAGSFIFILIARKDFLREIRYAGVILVVGLTIYCVRAWRRGEWPFGGAVVSG